MLFIFALDNLLPLQPRTPSKTVICHSSIEILFEPDAFICFAMFRVQSLKSNHQLNIMQSTNNNIKCANIAIIRLTLYGLMRSIGSYHAMIELHLGLSFQNNQQSEANNKKVT